MTNLTKHIADGPYRFMHGDPRGVVFSAKNAPVLKTYNDDADAVMIDVLNFPAKVLEVLREMYKTSVEKHGSEEARSYRYSPNIEAHTILTIAERMGFSREDVTR